MVEVSDGVGFEEEVFVNARGLRLFTCRWLPLNKEIKALVFLCHGYGMECSIFMKETGLRLAQAGYAVFGIDYEGHGKSEGLRCHIQKFSNVVDDCAAFCKNIKDRQEYKNKASFLFGESMGGAVALLIHRKQPREWNGAVLEAPMCKISEELKPPRIVTAILSRLAEVIPTWKIVPTKDIIERAFKDPIKREEIRSNHYIYQEKPRVQTALELLNASLDLEQRLDEVTLPFLVLHGEDDLVTDPAISKDLYETARSFDKTIKTYPGMWHGLTSGEPDDNIELVFRDVISWLNARSHVGRVRTNPLLESSVWAQGLHAKERISAEETESEMEKAERRTESQQKYANDIRSKPDLELHAF